MGGSAPQRIEWIAEEEEGVTPSDPEWNPLSDTVTSFPGTEPDAGTEALRGVGDPDPDGFYNGPVELEGTFEYYLQNWFVDGSGNTLDPGHDCIRRASDNSIGATHSYLLREEHDEGGVNDTGRRIYVHLQGGHPGELTVPFETEEGLPILNEFEYQFERGRAYEIHQPADGGSVVNVVSDSPDDTSQSITLENEDASSTETLDLDGDTEVVGTTTFEDLDAAHLSGETQGTVTLTDSNDNTLMEIPGISSYRYDEGDRGVPALGSGSRAGAIGSEYVTFNSDTIDYGTDGAIAAELVTSEMVFSQELDSNSRQGTDRMNVHATSRVVSMEGDIGGPNVLVDQWADYFQENAHDIVFESTGNGAVTLPNARLITPGEDARETDQAKLLLSCEWESEGAEVTAA